MRNRYYGNGDQFRVKTVTQALAAISKTCQLVGRPSPIYEAGGEYIFTIKHLIEGFWSQELSCIPQMAVPVDVTEVDLHMAYLNSNTRSHAVGDLITAEFYFLLRSVEYTRTRMVH